MIIPSAKEVKFSVWFVRLSAGLRKNYKLDFHVTWWQGRARVKETPVTFLSGLCKMVHLALVEFRAPFSWFCNCLSKIRKKLLNVPHLEAHVQKHLV